VLACDGPARELVALGESLKLLPPRHNFVKSARLQANRRRFIATSVGDEAYNQKLSERRAQAVVDFLAAQGVGAGRVTAIGMGETKPRAATPDTPWHRFRTVTHVT
jgi:hypothetical protein